MSGTAEHLRKEINRLSHLLAVERRHTARPGNPFITGLQSRIQGMQDALSKSSKTGKMRIMRYDIHGTSHGETIFSNGTVRDCLEYLRDIFKGKGVTREGYTFERVTSDNIYHYAIVRDRS